MNIEEYIFENTKCMLETILDREPKEQEIDNIVNKIDIEDIYEYIDSKIQEEIED